jgi:hypothetical protein
MRCSFGNKETSGGTAETEEMNTIAKCRQLDIISNLIFVLK